jgi:hypothetical protein
MTLDDFFGPRQTTDGSDMTNKPHKSGYRAVPTNWPHAQERLRAVLDAFEEAVDYHPRAEAVRTAWMAGARAFTDEFGEDGELVKRAYRKMMNAGLTVATPRSLITMARRLRKAKAALSDNGVSICGECHSYPCTCDEE